MDAEDWGAVVYFREETSTNGDRYDGVTGKPDLAMQIIVTIPMGTSDYFL